MVDATLVPIESQVTQTASVEVKDQGCEPQQKHEQNNETQTNRIDLQDQASEPIRFVHPEKEI